MALRSPWGQTPYIDIYNEPWEEEQAALRLIQPQAVAHLIHPMPPGYRVSRPFVESVARFFQARFRRGAFRYRGEGRRRFDRWQHPAFTLLLGQGDCEDFAIVGTSILRHETDRAWLAVGHVYDGGAWGGHAWIEGQDRQGFFLIEATTGDLYRHVRPRDYELNRYLG